MTQLKIFLCLTAMQICRNKASTNKTSRKTVYDKVFKVWLIQAPNISKYISRNGRAHDKVILFWGKNAIFAQNMAAPSKEGYIPKYVYWYQCFSV